MKKIIIDGLLTRLEEITEIDSEYICKLRNNPKNNQFLSASINISIENQKNWINLNKHKNNSLYFKIIEKRTDCSVGTISIYEINNSAAEFGRYICEKTIQAIEAEYMILKYGFDIIGLNRIFCRTDEKNRHVWTQHYKYGFKDFGTEIVVDRNAVLRVQEIWKSEYKQFNYKPILSLLQKFAER